MLNTAPQAAALWTALLLLLMVWLALKVVGQRRKHSVLLGDGGKDGVIQAQRVFGNAAEYVPGGIAALVLLTVAGQSYYLIHVVGALLLIGRIIHAATLSTTRLTKGRMVGMVLTFAAYIVAAVALLLYAFA